MAVYDPMVLVTHGIYIASGATLLAFFLDFSILISILGFSHQSHRKSYNPGGYLWLPTYSKFQLAHLNSI